MLTQFRLPLQFDPELLKEDVAGFAREEWTPHFNRQVYDGEWSGVALRSVGGDPRSIYPDPTAGGQFVATPQLARCSYVCEEVLPAFQCPLLSVRFLRLAAGSSIRPHRDHNLGFEDGEVRLHVPILTDDRVEFYVAGERVRMEPGETWYINTNLPHYVDNSSEQDRIHLVLDCVVNDWLRSLIPG